jgi:hypothetical protein
VFVGADLRRLREHLWSGHGYGVGKKAGRHRSEAAREELQGLPCRAGVFYQRFFTKGPRSEYFKVARGLGLSVLISQQQDVEAAVAQFMLSGAAVRK